MLLASPVPVVSEATSESLLTWRPLYPLKGFHHGLLRATDGAGRNRPALIRTSGSIIDYQGEGSGPLSTQAGASQPIISYMVGDMLPTSTSFSYSEPPL